MNPFTRTFAGVALALGTLPLPGFVHAATDNPPTTPATLTANRYSATAAGILWARSTDDKGAVRGYEVFRDGVPLGIRDALSVSEKALVPGRSYTYSVAAVDSAGQRSAPIRVTLNATGSTNAASAPPSAVPQAPATPTAPATPPAAGAPAAPTGLRSNAYSGTSGAIGWARPATFGLRYAVRRDGTPLTTTDGTGHVDRGLSPGRDYRYDIVAIDREGRRSAPASVTLRTQGTAAGATVGSVDPVRPNPFTPVAPTAPAVPTAPIASSLATTLAAPTGLRTSIYSARAGEIFWTRPATPGLRYDVSRDGAPLTTTDGVSYYDNALVAGRSHVYTVVAIDPAGRRSAPASVTLQGAGGSTVGAVPTAPATGSVPQTPTPVAPSAASARVTAPPSDVVSRLSLDTAFYERYVDADGVPIIASATVDPYALLEARWLFRNMMAGRPDLVGVLAGAGARLSILGVTEKLHDVPEFRRNLENDPQRGVFTRLAGGSGSATQTNEEDLLQMPGTYEGPRRPKSVTIHEIGHMIDLVALATLDPGHRSRLDSIYAQAMREGLWTGSYAAFNSYEYFAVGVEFWFGAMTIDGSIYAQRGFRSNSREELAAYDPRLAAMMSETFGDNPWRYAGLRDRTYGKEHLAGYTRDETRGLGLPNDGKPVLPDLLGTGASAARSTASGAPARIFFTNDSAQMARLYQILPDGTRWAHSLGTVPYATFPVDSHVGAVWEMTDTSDRAIGRFRVESGARVAVVRR